MNSLPTSSHTVAWAIAAFALVAFATVILRAEPVHLKNTTALIKGGTQTLTVAGNF